MSLSSKTTSVKKSKTENQDLRIGTNKLQRASKYLPDQPKDSRDQITQSKHSIERQGSIERNNDAEKACIKVIPRESTERRSDAAKAYINVIDKLPSIGPLNITDLTEFLTKSKIDFNHLYKEKTTWNFKISDFNFVKDLGSGAFGKVILAELKQDDTLYAIKVIDKRKVVEKKHVRYISNEKRILQSINFPFVVYLKYFFVDFNNLYFVMPFVPGGDFYYFLRKHKPLSEADAKFYTSQLVLALEYLHNLEVIHRDLKPENIMIDALGYLKLADFGQCIRCYGNDKTWTFTGTPEYMAPEILIGRGYDCAVDWWSLGVTVFEFCAGYRPFRSKKGKSESLYEHVLSVNYSIPKTFSKHLKSFIKHLLVGNPDKRLANYFKGTSKIKSHAWLNDTKWLELLNRTVEAPFLPDVSGSESKKTFNNTNT